MALPDFVDLASFAATCATLGTLLILKGSDMDHAITVRDLAVAGGIAVALGFAAWAGLRLLIALNGDL